MNTEGFKGKEVWFVTGSQNLYGEEVLTEVAAHSRSMVDELNASDLTSVPVVWKPVVLTGEGIAETLISAGANSACIGVITWMHTFSPAKMWIRGLSALTKPLLHLHTQFNRDIPWDSIDMDFMNLNQSAHGDREYGHIGARLGIPRRVIAGFWKDKGVQSEIDRWMRAAAGLDEMRNLRVARFGDNMRDVAVTEGDKVAAQIALGMRIDGFGVGDLVERVRSVNRGMVDEQMDLYTRRYTVDPSFLSDPVTRKRIEVQAEIEQGLKMFLQEGRFGAFTTTFEDLHGLPQLPGLAVQDLMYEGYGFGAEGDWKHAAMVRSCKVMAKGLPGGTSFMEDYTYNLDPADPKVLGAHMLEVCPSICRKDTRPEIQVHPLGIGGKDDPARLVFDGEGGEAFNVSLVDMGNRFRLVLNEVQAHRPDRPMPRLPVARVLWTPLPDFKTGLEGWILAGGAHHTVFSTALNAGHIADFAGMSGIELIRIGRDTTARELERDLVISRLAAGRGV
ncbi:MAG: L-arabinose isomerase [Spirochaetales bacterium]|nr:L-arabinose isomerase [Spirochaetales bacterium]